MPNLRCIDYILCIHCLLKFGSQTRGTIIKFSLVLQLIQLHLNSHWNVYSFNLACFSVNIVCFNESSYKFLMSSHKKSFSYSPLHFRQKFFESYVNELDQKWRRHMSHGWRHSRRKSKTLYSWTRIVKKSWKTSRFCFNEVWVHPLLSKNLQIQSSIGDEDFYSWSSSWFLDYMSCLSMSLKASCTTSITLSGLPSTPCFLTCFGRLPVVGPVLNHAYTVFIIVVVADKIVM